MNGWKQKMRMENYKALNELNRDGEFEFGRTANKIIAIYYFRQQRKWKILRKSWVIHVYLLQVGHLKKYLNHVYDVKNGWEGNRGWFCFASFLKALSYDKY